jgi:hypothetical protein
MLLSLYFSPRRRHVHGRPDAAALLEAGEIRENPGKAMMKRERERERRMGYLNIMLFLLSCSLSCNTLLPFSSREHVIALFSVHDEDSILWYKFPVNLYQCIMFYNNCIT